MNTEKENVIAHLDKELVSEVEHFKSLINSIKTQFDMFDSNNKSEQARNNYVEKSKDKIFDVVKKHFDKIWRKITTLDKNSYVVYRKYYQEALLPFFGNSQINSHIYNKPLGYAGDFIIMNYIYDYNDKYLGASSFEKLINNLTCNIMISKSNLLRREYLKGIINAALEKKGKDVKIASIASGPARELLDMLEAKRIPASINVVCFDFEDKAFEYVMNKINAIYGANAKTNIKLIKGNVVDIIRKKEVREKIAGQDLIYAFGIYDYLSDIIAKKLTSALFECLNPKGELITCNASFVKSNMRAYYEFLGEWEMVYRTKEEMLKLTEGLDASSVSIKDDENDCYIYTIIDK